MTIRKGVFLRFWLEKFAIATLLVSASAFAFIYVNKMNADLAAHGAAFTGLETWVDAYIPFIPQFVWFYFLYYLWVLAVIPVLNDRESFYHTAASFAVIQVAAVTTFILFPSFMVRPQVLGEGWSYDLVRWMYKADEGFNLIPSLHVGHSTLVALTYRAYKPKVFPIIAAGTFMISLSTVFIKQHYIIDIPVGFAFALGAFYLTAPLTSYVRAFERKLVS
jgi:membrane-associated phospholipid phosphatase